MADDGFIISNQSLTVLLQEADTTDQEALSDFEEACIADDEAQLAHASFFVLQYEAKNWRNGFKQSKHGFMANCKGLLLSSRGFLMTEEGTV
jgi:hypothetical protein